jgi:hypothetical protein
MRANSNPPLDWVRAPNRRMLRTENASPSNSLMREIEAAGSGGVASVEMASVTSHASGS